jgi:hypothetical protein
MFVFVPICQPWSHIDKTQCAAKQAHYFLLFFKENIFKEK